MRVIKNQWVEDWEEHPEDIQPFPQQLLTSSAQGGFGAMSGQLDQDVDPEVVAMPCGQGAGGIRDIRSCKEIVDDLMREARETIERIAGLL
jgi:NAD(P)H-dependent flavin oxidoreductase YrpB (nitropropane dioxygenase family)